MGLVGTLYIRSIYGFEDFFEKNRPGNYYALRSPAQPPGY